MWSPFCFAMSSLMIVLVAPVSARALTGWFVSAAPSHNSTRGRSPCPCPVECYALAKPALLFVRWFVFPVLPFLRDFGEWPVSLHCVQCLVRVQEVVSSCLPLHLWHLFLSCLGFCLVIACVSGGAVALTLLMSFFLADMYSWALDRAFATVIGCCT